MRRATGSLLIAVLSAVAVDGGFAMGFGRVSSATSLGQPLNFAVGLRQDPDEFVDAECVAADVRLGDDVRLPRERVRVSIEGQADSPQRVLRVTSPELVNEPIVSIVLHVGCPPRLSREFVTFIDPPMLQLAQAQPAEPAPAPAAAPGAAAASPPAAPAAPIRNVQPSRDRDAAAPPRRAPPRRTARAPGTGTPAATPPATVAAAPRPQAAASTRARPAPPPPAGPRLQLEPAEMAPRAASAPPAEAAPAEPAPAVVAAVDADRIAAAVAAAASAADAANRELALERERARRLEDELAKLRADQQKMADGLAALRTQLQQAQPQPQQGPSHALLWALALLAALLGIVLLVLLYRRSRERQALWWADANAMRGAASTGAPADAIADSGYDSRPEPPGATSTVLATPLATPPASPAPVAAAAVASPIAEAAVAEASGPQPPPAVPPVAVAVDENRHETSVEELMDLEQQADFFVVLGQDEAAIDLLMNHLRGTGGISPLPYLKLLEIYRRRGEQEPYERLRDRLNRRFNAYAPAWDADPVGARTLEDYPAVVARLQRHWPDPQDAMDTLEQLLFRRDEGETFDLPAYGELLFLYAIARDHLERTIDPASVDIDLPIGSGDAAVPMASTIALHPRPAVERPLAVDFDVTAPAEAAPASRQDDDGVSVGSGFGDRLRRRR